MAAKILLCGGNRVSQVVWCIWRGFQRIGCDVKTFPTRGKTPEEMVRLVRIVKDFQPDLLFWAMCKHDCPEEFVAKLRQQNSKLKTVFHSFDDPFKIDENGHPRAHEFQFAVTCCESSVGWYKDQGVAAITLYPPCDPDLHGNALSNGIEQCDFSFAATNVYPRDKYGHVLASRAEIVRKIADLGRLHLYGPWNDKSLNWGGLPKGKSASQGLKDLKSCSRGFRNYSQMPTVFVSSAINLNSHVRPDAYRYLNERTIICLGSGGFMLSDKVNGMEELFVPDKEIVVWSTLDELREKAIWWLAHPKERAAVAAAGQARALREHSNVHHAQAVLKLCHASSK